MCVLIRDTLKNLFLPEKMKISEKKNQMVLSAVACFEALRYKDTCLPVISSFFFNLKQKNLLATNEISFEHVEKKIIKKMKLFEKQYGNF